MSQYYEPQNQPAEPGLIDSKSSHWPVEDFLESVDIGINMDDNLVWKLSDFSSRVVPPVVIDPRIIVVDGPIGAGKSTFCKHLKKYLIDQGFEATIIEEAVADNHFGQNGGITLEEYYKNPRSLLSSSRSRWSMHWGSSFFIAVLPKSISSTTSSSSTAGCRLLARSSSSR